MEHLMHMADSDAYSMHFAQFATKLEQHLRRNGISCHDADMIIEESSGLYFEKARLTENKFLKLVRKHDPARLFVESAHRAIERHLPEAKDTFGSHGEISRCIR